MKYRSKSVLCLILGIILSTGYAIAQAEFLSGGYLDNEGNLTKISRIRADGFVNGFYKGKTISIAFSKLKRIENLGNHVYRVTNLNGEMFNMEKCRMATHNSWDCLEFSFYDEISMEEKKFLLNGSKKVNRFRAITFEPELGRLRYNQRTKQFFPPDYIFDPFTGEKLVWRNPED